MAIEWIEGAAGIDSNRAFAAIGIGNRPEVGLVSILEGSVADQFGIDTAVGGKVDILKENAP